MHSTKISEPRRGLPRSLRLRLILWYGSLIAVALGFFALLFLFLATDAINQSVDSALRTEARVAMLDILHDLSPVPPYWPGQLSLHVVDTYKDPGVVVEVLDAQGRVRYLSADGTSLPLSNEIVHTALAGQPPVFYNTTVDSQHVRVEVLPIRAPTHGVSGDNKGVPEGNGPVIGVLLVTKSLSDVDATLLLLRALLLLSGVATLAGTLIARWLIVARALHPLSELLSTARSIAAPPARGTHNRQLGPRPPQPPRRPEIAPRV